MIGRHHWPVSPVSLSGYVHPIAYCPDTHTPNPKAGAKTLTTRLSIISTTGSRLPLFCRSPIKPGSLNLSSKLMFAQIYFACELSWMCQNFPLRATVIKLPVDFYRGNSFLRLAGVWLGDFWISFIGTNHYWISHCGKAAQSLRAIKRVTELHLLVGKFHDTYKAVPRKWASRLTAFHTLRASCEV